MGSKVFLGILVLQTIIWMSGSGLNPLFLIEKLGQTWTFKFVVPYFTLTWNDPTFLFKCNSNFKSQFWFSITDKVHNRRKIETLRMLVGYHRILQSFDFFPDTLLDTCLMWPDVSCTSVSTPLSLDNTVVAELLREFWLFMSCCSRNCLWSKILTKWHNY